MQPELVALSTTLAVVFDQYKRMTIPIFQRQYVWDRERAERLFDDLVSGAEESASWVDAVPRFLGSFLLCGTLGGRDIDPVDVIDGQHRLITLTMLAACLRDRLGSDPLAETLDQWIGPDERPSLVLRPLEAAWFREHIQLPRGTEKKLRVDPDREGTSEWHLVQNREVLRKGVNGLQPEERVALAQYLARCRVVLLHSDDHDDAYQIFLAINEGGVPLTDSDVFQAELLGPIDEEEQRRYRTIIDQVAKYRREHAAQPGSRGKTFFSHLALAHGWRAGLVKATRLAIREAGGPEPFVRTVFVPHADAYLQFTGAAPLPDSLAPALRDHLDGLVLLGQQVNDDWLSTAMILWTRYGPDTEEARIGFSALDRCAHALGILGLGATPRRKRFSAVNTALRAKNFAGAVAKMELSSDERLTIRTNLATALHPNDHSMCRVVLVRLDACRSGRPLSEYRALALNEGDDGLTVEHILPQGPTLTGDAKVAWSHFPYDGDRQRIAQYLGNLTLTTRAGNRALGQGGLPEKLPILLGAPYPGLAAGLEGQLWDLEGISARHDALMEAALDLWRWPGPYPRLSRMRPGAP